MAESLDIAATRWSPTHRRARRDRTVEAASRVRPREILEERLDADGALRGPYETQYSIVRGYAAIREIIRP